jgi:hypothetical protein
MTDRMPTDGLGDGPRSSATKRRRALDEMTREAEELGLYD